MMMLRNIRVWRVAGVILVAVFCCSSCASTGPKISKADIERIENEFNSRFFSATENWYPRIFRIGYRLVSAKVPEHGKEEPQYNFVGVGTEELKTHIRTYYHIPPSVKGVHVVGVYPGSKAESLDLRQGDLITKMDGKNVNSVGRFYKRIRKAKGAVIDTRVWRNGKEFHVALPVEKVYYNAQFFLSPTPDFNAAASISKIYVAIGAVRYSKNDDELAVVMGHELAHVSLHHSHKHMGIGVASSLVYAGVSAVLDELLIPGLGDFIVSPVEKATDAAVTRRYEREADYFGLQHTFHAGFNVENGSRVFARLATESPNFAILSSTFATHPKWSERYSRMQKTVEYFETQYPDRFPQEKSPDWDVVVPVKAGETLNEALRNLLKEKPREITYQPEILDTEMRTTPARNVSSVPLDEKAVDYSEYVSLPEKSHTY